MFLQSIRARRGIRKGRLPERNRRWLLERLEDRTLLAVDYWTGASAHSGGNDNWSNGGNWSLGVPGTSDTADFTSSQSQVGTAVVDRAFTVGALVIDNTWGGTLNVNNALTVNGNLTLASGTVGGTAILTASGTGSQWTGGTFTGSLANGGTLTISASSTLYIGGTLTNAGTILDTTTQTIAAQSGTMITNRGIFNFEADGALNNANGATGTAFNNTGTLEMTAGSGTAAMGLPVDDSGTIEGDSGTLQLTGGGNSGTGTDTITAADGATVILGGSFSGNFGGQGAGAVDLSSTFGPAFTGGGAGATLDFTGSLLQWSAYNIDGTVTNDGTFTISGNSTTLYLSGTLNNAGTILDTATSSVLAQTGTMITNGGIFNFEADGTLNYANGATGTSFVNSGMLEMTASSGTATMGLPVDDSGTIEGDSGTLQLTGGGSSGSGTDNITTAAGAIVTLSGSFSGNFTGTGAGTVDLSSQFTPAFTGTGASLDFSGTVLQWNANDVGGTVINNGTLTISGSTNQYYLSGTLTNNGTIVDENTATIACNTGVTIVNEGIFNFNAGGTLTSGNGATGTVFNNTGTLEMTASSAVATMGLPLDNTGSVEVKQGTLSLQGGGVVGGTYLVLAGATLTFGNDNVTTTSIAVPSDFTAGPLNWGATFAGTATDNSGSGLASVGVSLFDGTNYYSGTGFESPTAVFNAAALSGGSWNYTIDAGNFQSDLPYAVASAATDNHGGSEPSNIASVLLVTVAPLTEVTLTPPHGTGALNINPFVGPNAGLKSPTDPIYYNGSFYVPNMGNETVSQVQFTQPTNVTTTVGASAELDTPVGLAFDKSGNLYIASFDGNAIVEVTAAGTIVEQFAKINSPNAPIVYNGELYVCDKYDNQIMEVNLASQQVQTYVNNTFGLSNPIDMAIDPAGNLYVCSQNNNTIYEVTPGGNNATAITANNNNNLLDSPVSMVMGPDGNLYVYNSGNSAVIEVALPSGKQSVYANLSGSVAGTFAGLVFGPDGYLYVANNGNSTMSQLAPGSLVEGQGITNQTVLHFTDGNPSDTASDYSATVHLGDGNTVTLSSSGAVTGPPGAGLQIVNDPAGGFDVQLTYPYPEFLSNATFSVTVDASDGATLGPSPPTSACWTPHSRGAARLQPAALPMCPTAASSPTPPSSPPTRAITKAISPP